jgi:hypothetical protein
MIKETLGNSGFKRYLDSEHHNEDIYDRVNALEKKLNLIITKLDSVEKGTDKMNSHIDFINDIYKRVQTPLFWICDRINYMRGYKMSYVEKTMVKSNLSTINDQD